MTRKFVLLDSTPLGLLADKPQRPDVVACRRWAGDLLAAGHVLFIPEAIDYELRRELVRAGRSSSVGRLDGLQKRLVYLPLNTDIMLEAADQWAAARNRGLPTAGNRSIDIDIVLIAQAVSLQLPNAVIATANVKHLSPFFPADLWTNITP